MSSRNHWVSGHGPFDRCAACGEEVPNASETGPCIVTGHCKGATTSPLWLRVCDPCYARAPFFGVGERPFECLESGSLRLTFLYWRPGWCEVCRRWMGDAQHAVHRVPVVADLVSAFVEAFALVWADPWRAPEWPEDVKDFLQRENRAPPPGSPPWWR